MTFNSSLLHAKTILRAAIETDSETPPELLNKLVIFFTDGSMLQLDPTIVHESSPPEFGAKSAIEVNYIEAGLGSQDIKTIQTVQLSNGEFVKDWRCVQGHFDLSTTKLPHEAMAVSVYQFSTYFEKDLFHSRKNQPSVVGSKMVMVDISTMVHPLT